MPIYDYVCAACGRRFEVIHGLNDSGPTTCPLCGKGPVRKAFAAPAIHFKGSGWAKKERRAGKTSSGSSSTSGSSSDGDSGSKAGGGDTGSSSSSPDKGTSKASGSGSGDGSGASSKPGTGGD